MKGVLLRGGEAVTKDGDVKVHVPTANLQAQALVTNPATHAILVPKERDPGLAQFCARCKSPDVVVEVHFTHDPADAVRLCRACVSDRAPGNPIVVNLARVE